MSTNIIVNGGFEQSDTSIAPWVAVGPANQSGIDVGISPYEGTRHFHADDTTFYQNVTCNEGSTYDLNFYAVAIGNSMPKVRTTFGTLDVTFTVPNGNGTIWNGFSGSATCNSSADSLTFYALETTTVRFDAISLTTTDTPSAPSSSATSSSSSSSDHTGAIAGGVVGGVAVISLALILIWFLRRRLKLQTSQASSEVEKPTMAIWRSGSDGTKDGRVSMWGDESGTSGSVAVKTPVVIPEIQEEQTGNGPDRYDSFQRPSQTT